MTQRKQYQERRTLRGLEALWTRGERVLDRLTGAFYNPLYHTGTLAIFLIAVIVVTGAYLTIFYRPGMERAFVSVDGMTATWLGTLMRTVHRYASDALIVVSMTHVIKIFLADRFWGSRWLAWVSGWGLMALFWVLGVMGYWLVWDQTAQWLTEYVMEFSNGSSVVSFFSGEAASGTFTFFVIILFLHVFLTVIVGLGLAIHNARLQRTRWWPPRWVWLGSLLVLLVAALVRPAAPGVEADLGVLVGPVELDFWYLGFLPLASLFSAWKFWLGLVLIFLVAVGLPWLLRGGVGTPAVVIDDKCTGCVRCEVACPYEAIEMRPRSGPDSLPVAIVEEGLCTSCGLCVAVCPTQAIELPGRTSNVILDELAAALAAADDDAPPTVLFTCERHLVHGSVPGVGGDDAHGIVASSTWTDADGTERPLLTCLLPCTGMTNVRWMTAATRGGAGAVATLSCPTDDCRYREGPKWPALAFGRGWLKRSSTAGRLDAAPGDLRLVTKLLNRVSTGTEVKVKTPGQRRREAIRVGGAVLVSTVMLFLVTVLPVQSVTPDHPTQARLRVALAHRGEVRPGEVDPAFAESLPENVDIADVVGGERFPVELRVTIDGEALETISYGAAGIRSGGRAFGLESWWLDPGTHLVKIEIRDDGETWRVAYDATVEILAGRSLNLAYVEGEDRFVQR